MILLSLLTPKMNIDMTKKYALVVIVFVLGGVLGWVIHPDGHSVVHHEVHTDGPRPLTESANETVLQQETVSVVEEGQLFQHLDASEMAHLAAVAAQSDDPLEKEALLRLLVNEWAKTDPDAALTFANEAQRNDLLQIALARLGATQPDAALAWLDTQINDPGLQDYLSMSVYQGIARLNPTTAMDLALSLPQGSQRDSILHVVVDEWAKKDVHAVFDWIETVEMSAEVESLYSGVMYRYITAEPQEAAALVAEMHPCALKVNFAATSARLQAQEDPVSALAWADGLDPEAREAAMIGIMDSWAARPDASGAIDFIIAGSESMSSDLARSAIISLVHQQPEQVIASIPKMSRRDQLLAVEQVAGTLSVSAPERCASWMQTLPQGPLRDGAIEHSLDASIRRDTSDAFRLSETVDDESLRLALVSRVVERWSAWDFVAAEAALADSSSISEEAKDALLDRVSQNLRMNDILLP